MLKRSFIHIPGVGVKTENCIWEKGIFSWDNFLTECNKLGLPIKKIEKVNNYLISSISHLKRKNINFFSNTLPRSEFWRLYHEFKNKVAFLDIETTGLSIDYDEITLIGLFNGKNAKTYIAGKNLDSFLEEINKYALIITYNGALFDLPFIKARFPKFISPVHIDLRFFLKRLGFSGGLKAIEEQFGIKRSEDIKGIDGFGATILWDKYNRGDISAIKLLIEYNIADIMNLKTLMEQGYEMMQNKLFSAYKFQR